ncbi:SRPBCC family protein [Acidipila rosea]|uniref:Putative membrane protein n=1 Tax=Acidipila rosea TaxID=768535 RepID=A0A4R1L6P5_9BACT|nr:SRPBCC family protein [Acidipila rosea]MBW4028121.1 SRPBCC family protein [Acidobacteriota bacterium]MBW4046110.1 SRPBCC family protein [Acidobacteriota bacterium]TCK71959.1 putative membrane protein [Acidipila rosea]
MSPSLQKTDQNNQRLAVMLGCGLALYGLSRRSKTGIAIAAAGAAVALAGRQTGPKTYSAHASFTINCSPEDAYRFWRDLENLPLFMHHLESVRVTGDLSDWVALGPMNTRVHWAAEIVDDQENQSIAWRSLPGSDLSNSGSVSFHPGTGGRGTIIAATMVYTSPGGALGRTAALLMGRHPEFALREDLRRFKSLLETGEIPTTKGQSHGPRGIHGQASQVLLREKQNMPAPPLEHEDESHSNLVLRRSA